MIKQGKVRALGVTSAVRVASLSDVAPIAGWRSGFEAVAWQCWSRPRTRRGRSSIRFTGAEGRSGATGINSGSAARHDPDRGAPDTLSDTSRPRSCAGVRGEIRRLGRVDLKHLPDDWSDHDRYRRAYPHADPRMDRHVATGRRPLRVRRPKPARIHFSTRRS